MRVILGAALAPLVGLFLLGVSLTGPPMVGIGAEKRGSLRAMLAGTMIFSSFVVLVGARQAYRGILFVGLPSLLLLRLIEHESAVAYAACGFVGGAFFPPVVRPASFGDRDPGILAHLPAWFPQAYAGSLVMLAFWFIARAPLP